MWKILIRPAMIVVPLAVGFFFPQAGILAKSPYNVVRISLFFMIFMASLGIEFRDLQPVRDHWKLLIANVLMGLIPYWLCKWFLPDHPELALIVFFIGITPTAAASSVIISLLNGKVGFGLTGFAITNIGISLALLGLLPYTTGKFTADFCLDVAYTITLIIAVPMILAQIVRKYFPKVREFMPKFKMVSLSLWSLSLFILAALARQFFNENPGESLHYTLLCGGISLVFCIANFYFGGKLATDTYRPECSQLLGQKNTVFSICLALEYATDQTALALTFYIVWHNIYNALQLYAFDRKQRLSGMPEHK
jgi:BASS family bile acid:Na+ symporter